MPAVRDRDHARAKARQTGDAHRREPMRQLEIRVARRGVAPLVGSEVGEQQHRPPRARVGRMRAQERAEDGTCLRDAPGADQGPAALIGRCGGQRRRGRDLPEGARCLTIPAEQHERHASIEAVPGGPEAGGERALVAIQRAGQRAASSGATRDRQLFRRRTRPRCVEQLDGDAGIRRSASSLHECQELAANARTRGAVPTRGHPAKPQGARR